MSEDVLTLGECRHSCVPWQDKMGRISFSMKDVHSSKRNKFR